MTSVTHAGLELSRFERSEAMKPGPRLRVEMGNVLIAKRAVSVAKSHRPFKKYSYNKMVFSFTDLGTLSC